jgi:hypothetical protein
MSKEWEPSLKKLAAEMGALKEEKRQLLDKLSAVERRLNGAMQAHVLLEELSGRKPVTGEFIGETVSDKIRYVLSVADMPLTGQEILDRLARLGFAFEGNSRPMATLHSVLHRLVTARKPLIEEAPRKNGLKAWRRVA